MADERRQNTGDDPEFQLPESEIDLQHHTELPSTRFSSGLDRLVAGTGKILSWLWLAVIAIILISVISRYAFGQGSIMLEELSWHLFGVAWTMGLGYALVNDDHVRVDVLHERFGLRTQAWIELLGLLLLLFPFLFISVYYALPYAYESYLQNETSQAPSGLPYRFLLKSFLPLALIFIGLGALSRVLKCTALLFGWPQPVKVSQPQSTA
ncbi:MAG: TRAP transporter small permease subunit [Candidatus Competibacterales bacterium]|nr:TRAP transporter small permease subunit [Candidatus Competibacterales bacterium]